MLRKLPIIDSSISCIDLLYGLSSIHKRYASEEFSLALAKFTQSKYICLTNCGIASFYIILKMLGESSKKKEIILPAYTAGSLVVGAIKAGLKPVLCDISEDDFNLDRESLMGAVTEDTLGVVCVHMFGIGMDSLNELRKKIPSNIFLIEDCAQAMGSRVAGKYVGGFGEVSFFSFNRGKNLSLYGGGCITTNSQEFAEILFSDYDLPNKEGYQVCNAIEIFFKILALSFAVNHWIYGLGYPIISKFKDIAPPEDFSVGKITDFQAGLGLNILVRIEQLFSKRYQNGMSFINALKDRQDLILPKISQDSRPAFNRLPILFKDLEKKEELERRLWREGIETSRMYLKPLHHMFNMGYSKEDFPRANYFAEHLLTFPVHPSVKQEDLSRMIDIIRQT